jgi:hypothetical protein
MDESDTRHHRPDIHDRDILWALTAPAARTADRPEASGGD